MMKRWINEIAENVLGIKCIISQLILFCVFCAGLLVIGLGIQVVRAEIMPQTALRNLETGTLLYIPFTQMYVSHDIYTVNADGTELTALTNTPENECYPTWSPDGSEIAFARRKGGHFVISVMDADGTNIRDLMEPDLTRSINHVECTPAWSPDGSEIAFTSSRDGNLDIYVMNADGSNPRNLTNHPAGDAFPAWSPEGDEITFTSDRDGNLETYAISIAGSLTENLSNSTNCDEIRPQWLKGNKELINVSDFGIKKQISIIDRKKKQKENVEADCNLNKVSFCPLGQQEVALSDGCSIFILNLESKESHRILDTSPKNILEPIRRFLPVSSHNGKILLQSSVIDMKTTSPSPQWLYLCADGQLISPMSTMPRPDNNLMIIPTGNEIALVHSGPKWQGTYAIVRANGKIHLISPTPKEISKKASPLWWPFFDEQKKLAMPPWSTLISKEKKSKEYLPPENTIGWVFILADGSLLAPFPSISKPEHVLWIVRDGCNLNLVRSGPQNAHSLYAVVNPDRSIQATSPDTHIAPWWPYIDEKGNLAPLDGIISVISNATVPITIHKDGSGSMPATLEY